MRIINKLSGIDNDLKSITEKHFDFYAVNWEKRLKDHCYLTRYNTVKAILRDSAINVADLGCGTGDYSHLFSSSVNYIGIDISLGMINKAKMLYPNRKFFLEDVEKTSIPNNYADCILAIGLFEYLEKPQNLVDEIYRVAKKGAQIICAFPNKSNITKENVSFFAKPVNLIKKAARIFSKKKEKNYLAPKEYVKPPQIIHRKFDEADVLKLFNSSRFVHTKTRFTNFNVITYFTGIPLLKRLDEYVSNVITKHNFDNLFSIYGSILLTSFDRK